MLLALFRLVREFDLTGMILVTICWFCYCWAFDGRSAVLLRFIGPSRWRTSPPESSTKPVNSLNSLVFRSMSIRRLLSSLSWAISIMYVLGALPSFFKYNYSISSSFFYISCDISSIWVSWACTSSSKAVDLSRYCSLACLSVATLSSLNYSCILSFSNSLWLFSVHSISRCWAYSTAFLSDLSLSSSIRVSSSSYWEASNYSCREWFALACRAIWSWHLWIS